MTTRKKITFEDDKSITKEKIKEDMRELENMISKFKEREIKHNLKRKYALSHVNGLNQLITDIEINHDIRISDLRNLVSLMLFLEDTFDFEIDEDTLRFRFAEDVEKDQKERVVQ